jgi:hypothetical protein
MVEDDSLLQLHLQREAVVPEEEEEEEEVMEWSTVGWTSAKLLASALLLWTAYTSSSSSQPFESSQTQQHIHISRRLEAVDAVPSYMENLVKDLDDRKKLFEETPPEEVKYWFEYTGALQVSSSFFIPYRQTKGDMRKQTTKSIVQLQIQSHPLLEESISIPLIPRS